jgi:hypothetical protein
MNKEYLYNLLKEIQDKIDSIERNYDESNLYLDIMDYLYELKAKINQHINE